MASTKVFGFGQRGQLLTEASLDAQGAVVETKNYLWLGSQPVAMSQAPAASGYELVYIHADHLDTPRYATRDSGAVVWKWADFNFGLLNAENDPDQDGIDFNLSLRFPGQYYDEDTNLFYDYFRDYDPANGRYMQPDPVGILYSYNDPVIRVARFVGVIIVEERGALEVNSMYGYAENSPTRMIDRYGLAPSGRPRLYKHQCSLDCQTIHSELIRLCISLGFALHSCRLEVEKLTVDCMVNGVKPEECRNGGDEEDDELGFCPIPNNKA